MKFGLWFSLDLKDYGPEKNRNWRYVFVIIDNFSKLGCTIPLKNKNAQTIKTSFESLFVSSWRKPSLFETDQGKEYCNSIFQNFLNNNNIKHYSRNSSLGVVFAERFNCTKGDILRKVDFEKTDSNWVDILPTITKQYNNRVHTSTKLTPIQASLKKNEWYVYHNLLHKRNKIKPKFKIHDLVWTADWKRTLSKGDTTNWSYKLYKITEIFIDTIPSYKINNLPERYNEALLKKTELPMKEYESVVKKLNLNWIEVSLTVRTYIYQFIC